MPGACRDLREREPLPLGPQAVQRRDTEDALFVRRLHQLGDREPEPEEVLEQRELGLGVAGPGSYRPAATHASRSCDRVVGVVVGRDRPDPRSREASRLVDDHTRVAARRRAQGQQPGRIDLGEQRLAGPPRARPRRIERRRAHGGRGRTRPRAARAALRASAARTTPVRTASADRAPRPVGPATRRKVRQHVDTVACHTHQHGSRGARSHSAARRGDDPDWSAVAVRSDTGSLAAGRAAAHAASGYQAPRDRLAGDGTIVARRRRAIAEQQRRPRGVDRRLHSLVGELHVRRRVRGAASSPARRRRAPAAARPRSCRRTRVTWRPARRSACGCGARSGRAPRPRDRRGAS